MRIDFVIFGKPRGKARPRVTKGNVYTPKVTKDYEQLVKTAFLQAINENGMHNQLPLAGTDGCVVVDIIACFEIPKSWSKKKREEAKSGNISPTVKPDVDNIAKIILDSLNGLAYHDDKQVTSCSVFKHYADEPMVIVMVSSG